MRRQKHSLSHYKLVTGEMGMLIPVGLMEALPGDTFQQSTSLLLRMSPLQAPVMHPVAVRVHHWFVPTRLVWDGFEDFITGGPDGTGTTDPYPTNIAAVTPAPGDLYDYLGVPIGREQPIGALSNIPLRGYNKIYNEWYRDQDLVEEQPEDDAKLVKVAWEKDYFTASRPWPQKGPQVTLPLGDKALVHGRSGLVNDMGIFSDTEAAFRKMDASAAFLKVHGSAETEANSMYADLSGATGADIIAVRQAFAIQRYQEARAQYGSRYTEYLRYLGVRPQDARLQRPEFLGGGKQTVAFSEVLQTGIDPVDPISTYVGTMRGHGIAAMRSNRYRYFCQEHGYIFTLLSVRPRTMYMDGLNRTWSRRTKEDYYQKELELIGQQEVFNREVYAKGDASDATVFGYNDRYSEYRHQYSKVAGEFQTILDYWHLGRKFSDTPTLNQAFTDCDPSKRIFSEQTQHAMWIMVSHSIQARRMLTKKTIGRII